MVGQPKGKITGSNSLLDAIGGQLGTQFDFKYLSSQMQFFKFGLVERLKIGSSGLQDKKIDGPMTTHTLTASLRKDHGITDPKDIVFGIR